MQKIDANILLRYILNDHKIQSHQAKEIIDNNIIVSTEMKHFFEQTQCILLHQEAILQALEYWEENTLDFVDCVLAGYAKVEKDKIYTFDKKLLKLIET